jgi:23S rRNA (adenine2503-C2)-methyltransferase
MPTENQDLVTLFPSSVPSILDFPDEKLLEWIVEKGQKPFRLNQIKKWLYQGRAKSFAEMSDLPQALRDELSRAFVIFTSHPSRHQSADDGTEKLLIDLRDGGQVECVLLRDGVRRTICVSSQVGCGMGCVFCASGLDGVVRNLSTGEIVEQMLFMQQLLPATERLSHIVMMGMGEPLANLDRVLEALDIAADPACLGISPRRITISTVGLPQAMDRLAEYNRPFNLAVSLHAPNDLLRNKIVPTNPKTGLSEILAASDRYLKASGRRLTFEYVLLAGLNDRDEHAAELARLLRGRIALLNVIPYNPVAGLPYRTPSTQAIQRFRKILVDAGIEVKFRQRKGNAIQAACGQLRRNPTASAELGAGQGV